MLDTTLLISDTSHFCPNGTETPILLLIKSQIRFGSRIFITHVQILTTCRKFTSLQRCIVMFVMGDSIPSKSNLKRKRIHEPNDDSNINGLRFWKRSNLAGLPIRTSSFSSQGYLWQEQQHIAGFSQPLTPVDSSDDEAYGQAESSWKQQYNPRPCSPSLSISNPSSLTVNVEPTDDDMDMTRYSDSFTTPPILDQAPIINRQSGFLSAPTLLSNDRVPTPITDKFNLSEDRSKSRSWRLSSSSMLSPVLDEDFSSILSPVESIGATMNTDPETLVRMENTSNGLGALSVACNDDEMMADDDNTLTHAPDRSIQSNHNYRNTSQGHGGGRRAKLHMGFRADCEKCQQRVPGHYSHIVWN